jgi:hypothetical protein
MKKQLLRSQSWRHYKQSRELEQLLGQGSVGLWFAEVEVNPLHAGDFLVWLRLALHPHAPWACHCVSVRENERHHVMMVIAVGVATSVLVVIVVAHARAWCVCVCVYVCVCVCVCVLV